MTSQTTKLGSLEKIVEAGIDAFAALGPLGLVMAMVYAMLLLFLYRVAKASADDPATRARCITAGVTMSLVMMSLLIACFGE